MYPKVTPPRECPSKADIVGDGKSKIFGDRGEGVPQFVRR